MALHKLVRRNHGGKTPASIKYQNLHAFEEGMILLSQSILETRRIFTYLHLHGSVLFKIPLKAFIKHFEAPQSMKIKIKLIFILIELSEMHGAGRVSKVSD